MLFINNKKDAQIYTKIKRVFEDPYYRENCLAPEKIDDEIIEIKRALRRYFKPKEAPVRIVKSYGIDGYISLVKLPDFIKDVESGEEYFEENLRLRCRSSMYDCTGDPFTSWYKVFQRRDGIYAYHSVGFDV